MTMLNALTVDLEDWFHGLPTTNVQIERWSTFERRIIPNTNLLLDIFRTYNVKATFFVLGYVAEHHPALVERVAAEGHEIAVHGYYHRFVSRLTPDEFARDIEQSISALERITGQLPVGHRAPYFSINGQTPWAFDILQQFDLRYDSSVFPIRSLLYAYPEAPRFPYRPNGGSLIEFPVSTIRLGGLNWPVAGGIYLRALPYDWFRWGLNSLNRRGQPAILYTHPYEFDLYYRYDQTTPRERLTHFWGRGHLAHKLERLLSEFRFGPLRCLLEGAQVEGRWQNNV